VKTITAVLGSVLGVIGIALVFVRAAAPAPAPAQRYSTQMVFLGLTAGCAITDHVENKMYFYATKQKGEQMELAMTMDLSKVGQPQIDVQLSGEAAKDAASQPAGLPAPAPGR
jgi:hypothetical protein